MLPATAGFGVTVVAMNLNGVEERGRGRRQREMSAREVREAESRGDRHIGAAGRRWASFPGRFAPGATLYDVTSHVWAFQPLAGGTPTRRLVIMMASTL